MPAVTPSSKSGTLITWLVVFVLLWVVGTVMAIYFYVDAKKARQDLDTSVNQYNEIIAKSDLDGGDVNDLKKKREDAARGFNAEMKVFDILKKERDDLAKQIDGGDNPDRSYQNSVTALEVTATQTKDANFTLPQGTTLVGAMKALADAVVARETKIAQLNDEVKKATEQVVDANKQVAAYRDKVAEEIKAQTDVAQQANTSLTNDRAAKDKQMQDLIASSEVEQKKAQDAIAAANAQITDLSKGHDRDLRIIEDLRNKLGQRRANTADSVVRQGDGSIVRVPGNGTVYINLGTGDQISEGLTFEVYDRTGGVPALGDPTNDENLPKGKASIEVIRVGAGSSECRIIYQDPRQIIQAGDLIANVVYDRNTKYQFFVYGDFDLDQNGVTVASDAEVVKHLITQWGGKVTDKINADTDFVVLGKEPQVLIPTKEEANDPIMQAKAQASQAAFDAYEEVKKQALDHHLPILNQNRFLYYVGYYESAKR